VEARRTEPRSTGEEVSGLDDKRLELAELHAELARKQEEQRVRDQMLDDRVLKEFARPERLRSLLTLAEVKAHDRSRPDGYRSTQLAPGKEKSWSDDGVDFKLRSGQRSDVGVAAAVSDETDDEVDLDDPRGFSLSERIEMGRLYLDEGYSNEEAIRKVLEDR
jgi:hypothetical protein